MRHGRPRKPVDLRRAAAVFRGPGRLEHRAATGMGDGGRHTTPGFSIDTRTSWPPRLGTRLGTVGKSGSSSPHPPVSSSNQMSYRLQVSQSRMGCSPLETRSFSFLEPPGPHRDSPMTNRGPITTRLGQKSLHPSVPFSLNPLRPNTNSADKSGVALARVTRRQRDPKNLKQHP